MNPETRHIGLLSAVARATLAIADQRHDRSGDGSVNRDVEMKQMRERDREPDISYGNRHERRRNQAGHRW